MLRATPTCSGPTGPWSLDDLRPRRGRTNGAQGVIKRPNSSHGYAVRESSALVACGELGPGLAHPTSMATVRSPRADYAKLAATKIREGGFTTEVSRDGKRWLIVASKSIVPASADIADHGRFFSQVAAAIDGGAHGASSFTSKWCDRGWRVLSICASSVATPLSRRASSAWRLASTSGPSNQSGALNS